MKVLVVMIAFYFVVPNAHAVQEFETVVTETKFNSSSRVVIDKNEIDKSRAKNITTLLSTQANISIVQSNFTPVSIFMRGGDSGHILILVDGVPFYDSSSIQRTINLNSIDIKSVQKIEVIKGSQSVLYGGQALTGVIKIDTIPKDIDKTSAQVLIQGGSFGQTAISAGGLQPVTDRVAVIVRGSVSQKWARSPVLDSDKLYPASLSTSEVAAVYRGPIEAILKLQTSFDRTQISTTANPSFLAADADNFQTSTYQSTATTIFSAKDIILRPILALSTQRNARQFEQSGADAAGNTTKQDYVGQLTILRLETTPVETKYFNLKLGGSFNQEKMVYRDLDVLKSDISEEFEGFFAKAEIPVSKNLQIEGGTRLDYRRMNSEISTHQIGFTLYEILKLEYATGFKHPSLFQLYSSYGNPNLKPEKSTSYSASLEANVTTELFSSFTVFEARFENLILTKGFPPTYDNISSSRTQGVEVVAGYRWSDQATTFNLSLGYQEPKDLDQGTWLPRRPLRTGSFKVRKEIQKAAFGIEVVHNGERRDRTGATNFGSLNPYTLAHATVEYQALSQLSVFARGQNIFDQRFESNFGFYDEGFNLIAGAEFIF